MNIDADMLQTLNRIMPDVPPPVSPQEQHRKALRDQLTAAQQQVEELASAIRLCDQDITAPQAIAAEIAALEQKRSEALAAGYLKRCRLVEDVVVAVAVHLRDAHRLIERQTRVGSKARATLWPPATLRR